MQKGEGYGGISPPIRFPSVAILLMGFSNFAVLPTRVPTFRFGYRPPALALPCLQRIVVYQLPYQSLRQFAERYASRNNPFIAGVNVTVHGCAHVRMSADGLQGFHVGVRAG